MFKRFLALIVAVVGLCGSVRAQETWTVGHDLYFAISTNVPLGGKLVWTNKNTYAWKFGSWSFVLPLGLTNTFSATVVSRRAVYHWVWTRVVTNELGDIQTNYLNQVTNITYTTWTNLLATNTTTNVRSHVYEAGVDFPENFYVRPGDMVRFTWTYTNRIPFYRVGMR